MLKLKPYCQDLLTQVGLYHRAKASCVYDVYWMLAGRHIIDRRRAEVHFYRSLLKGFRSGDLIFDIGANHGQKTDVFLRLGARVVAVEPDQLNQEVLKQKFLKLRLFKKPVVIVGKAVGDSNTVATMWIDAPGSAKNTLSPKWVETLRVDQSRFGTKLDFAEKREVQTITTEDLIEAYGPPFFIKIDVEGYELSVLRGMRRSVPYLSFEVNLPEFRPEGLHCVEVLGQMAESGRFNYTVDCERGLALKQWMKKREFLSVLSECREPSIEVFYRSCSEERANAH
jgi:FkbM family methyltransferase